MPLVDPEFQEQQPLNKSIKAGKQDIGVCLMDLRDLKGMIGTDQMGRFPVTLGHNHKYIFIMCDVDSNFIYGIPITLRKANELIRVFQEA